MRKIQGAEKTEKGAKYNRTVKTKLVKIVSLHHLKNAQTNHFYFLFFRTEIIVILFFLFLPLPYKTHSLDPWVLAPSSGQTVRSNVCERILILPTGLSRQGQLE
jgi:hypothetical protein